MPIIGGDDNMLPMALQVLQMAHERAARQGRQQIETAQPGQTVQQVGMSPKQFAELFGKNTPFDPNRVLKRETATDVVDTATTNYLKSLSPLQMLDVVATNMNNQSGVAGQTTMKGLEASRKTSEVRAQTGLATAQSVAGMIDQGIDAMKKAKPEIQQQLGQQMAFGKTAADVEGEGLTNQLKISALREAIGAQTNPNAPIHAFLKSIGLDLPTVLAGTAMGIQNLFDSWGRVWAGSRQAGFNVEEELQKAEIATAKEMSQKVFHGTLTPRQVLAVMRSNETGKTPAGLKGAKDLYDRSAAAYYNSAIADAMAKNDPFLKATADQIAALTKPGVDPHTLTAVNDLSTRAAGYAATLQQLGPVPSDPAGIAAWNQALEHNTRLVPKGGVHFGLFELGTSTSPSGLGTPTGVPAQVAPTSAPVAPVAPISGVPRTTPIGNVPAAQGLLKNQDGSTPGPQVSPEDWQAIMNYLQSLRITQQQPAPAGP